MAAGPRLNSFYRFAADLVLYLHVTFVAFVIVALGMICPLTTLEMWLRTKAGDAVYPGAFVDHWVQRILYYDAPAWVFALLYTAFGALVVASWVWNRPRPMTTG